MKTFRQKHHYSKNVSSSAFKHKNMSKLPILKPREVVRGLLKAGFFIHHQQGSHVQLRHRLYPNLRVTVPFHAKFDLPPSVIVSILRQAHITRDEFLELI